MSYIRSFIVLKDQYGVIVRFPRLHNYTGAYSGSTARPRASDANARMHYICMMLNYILIENYAVYKIDHVFKVTKEMLSAFFTDYALGPKADGGHRGSESVENCVHSCLSTPTRNAGYTGRCCVRTSACGWTGSGGQTVRNWNSSCSMGHRNCHKPSASIGSSLKGRAFQMIFPPGGCWTSCFTICLEKFQK